MRFYCDVILSGVNLRKAKIYGVEASPVIHP